MGFIISLSGYTVLREQSVPCTITLATWIDLNLQQTPRAATAVGDYVLDLDALLQHGILADPKLTHPLGDIFLKPYLNDFAALPISDRRTVREIIIHHLTTAESPLFKDESLQQTAFIPIQNVTMHLPMRLTDYTDFYSSLVHADKVRLIQTLEVKQHSNHTTPSRPAKQ